MTAPRKHCKVCGRTFYNAGWHREQCDAARSEIVEAPLARPLSGREGLEGPSGCQRAATPSAIRKEAAPSRPESEPR